MGNNISVGITADVADLQVKRAILSAELRTASKDLSDFAKAGNTGGMTDALRASMLGAATAVAGLKTQLAAVNAELSTTVTRASGAKTAFEGFQGALGGLAKVIAAAFVVRGIASFEDKMAEAATVVGNAAITFGLTTEQVQRLQGVAAGAGVPFEALTNAMQREDGAMTRAREGAKQTQEAFKTLGINIHEPIDNATLLQETMAGLSSIADPMTRVGIAMQVFGRNIQEVAPLLGLTKQQVDELQASIQAYGVVNDDAEQKGLALAQANYTLHIALMGLGNTLSQALAPAMTQVVTSINGMIKGFIDSYNSGGTAKQMLDAIAFSIKALVSAAYLTGLAFTTLWDVVAGVISTLGPLWKGFVDSVVGSAQQLADKMQLACELVFDALSQNFAKAATDVRASMQQMQRDSADTATKLIKDAHDISAAWTKGGGGQFDSLAAGGNAFLDGLWGPGAKPRALPPGNSGNGTVPDLQSPKKGKEQDPNQVQMQAWTDQLSMAEALAENSSQQFNTNESAREIAFWKTKLDAATTGSALWKAVFDKYQPLMAAQETERVREAKATEKQVTEDAIKGIEERTAAAVKGAADQLEAQKASLADQTAALKLQLDMGQISQAQYWSGVEGFQRQAAEDEAATAAKSLAATEAGLAAKLALQSTSVADAIRLNALQYADAAETAQKIAKVWADLFRQLNTDQASQVTQFKRQWDAMVNPMVSSFSHGLLQMAEGTKTFAQEMRSMGQSILNSMVGVIDKMVDKWLWGQIAQLTVSRTMTAQQVVLQANAAEQTTQINLLANLKQIQSDAATAGGAAYKAMAGIPPAPLWGVIAGGAAYAGVLAFEGLASAASGFDIPSGVNPLTQLHAREMVLPAHLADNVRDMSSGFAPSVGSSGASGNDGGGSGGGDIHLHVHAVDGDSVLKMFRNHKASVAKGLREMARGGVNTGFAPA